MDKLIRVVDEKRGIVQVTTLDERWYFKPSESKVSGVPEFISVPSVTWISGYYPKGIQYFKWLADHGWDEAEALKIAAGEKGSKVHKGIEKLLAGEVVTMKDKFINPKTGLEEEVTLEEYECLMAFQEWYIDEQPKILASEITVWGTIYRHTLTGQYITEEQWAELPKVLQANYEMEYYAGTVDFIYQKKDGRIGAMDFKTSQYIWPSHEAQVSLYKPAIKDFDITFLEILQLGYKKNKFKKFKVTDIVYDQALITSCFTIWKRETKNVFPKQKDYPLEIKLSLTKTSVAEVSATKATAPKTPVKKNGKVQ